MRKTIPLFLIALPALAQLTPAQFHALGKACIPDSDRILATAIVRTESAFRPWALSINYPEATARKYGISSGRVFLKVQPQSFDEAVRWTKELLMFGDTVSVGLMQVNIEGRNQPVEQLIDPCENLKTGWALFLEKYESAGHSVERALSAYNTGSVSRGISNGYANAVLSNRR